MLLKELLGELYKENMTETEIEKALNEKGLLELQKDNEKLKAMNDKLSSENAEKKKELRAKQTEEENKAQLEAEERQKIIEERDALKKKVTISEHKAKFLALGYDEKLAEETAEAFYSGDTEKVFANQKKQFEIRESAIKQKLLNETPNPQKGDDPKAITKEKFKIMSLDEKQELLNSNPEIFNSLNQIGGI